MSSEINARALGERFRLAQKNKDPTVRFLSSGTYGEVFEMTLDNGQRYAVKKYIVDEDDQDEDQSTNYSVVREMNSFANFSKSKHIIQCYGVDWYHEKRRRITVMFLEFAECDLRKYLDAHQQENETPVPVPPPELFRSTALPWNIYTWHEKKKRKQKQVENEQQVETKETKEAQEDLKVETPRWNKAITKAEHQTRMVFVSQMLESKLPQVSQSFAWERFGNRPVGLNVAEVRRLMHQLLSGLLEMNDHGFIHRDLKPQNLLLVRDPDTNQLNLRIGDLGLAKEINLCRRDAHTPQIMSLWYRAPEVMLGKPRPYYDYGVDMWSAGCVFVELATGRPLFYPDSNTEWDVLVCILQLCGTPCFDEYHKLDPNFKKRLPQWPGENFYTLFEYALTKSGVDLLIQMLQLNPEKRITLEDALVHPFFRA